MLSIAVMLVAGLLLFWPAAAHQITTPAGVIVDYSGLSSPATGSSCCNKMDCAPAEVTFDGGEGLLIRRLDGYPIVWDDPWFQVDHDVILPLSLDGGWHMCKLPRDSGPRCIIRPPDT
jgi:hypothetical protein